MRVKFTDGAPDFIALCIEKDKGWGEIEIVYGGKFHACLVLNVQADNVDLTAKFCFEPVNDGFNCGAANSIWRLKFEEDGRARPDHRLHFFCVIHQWSLARM